jgi:nicotinate-nucleotide adenylyltransferase
MMGADSLLNIRQWHRPSDLLLACDFIVGARPGFDLDDAEAALPEEIEVRPLPTEASATRLLELKARDGRESRLYLLMNLNEDISASEIRAALRAGDAGGALDPAVMDYIRAHGLYRHL